MIIELKSSGSKSLVADVVVPARNAAATLGATLAAIPHRRVRSVIVVDNASSDQTASVARDHNAIVVREQRVGYGAACRAGVRHLGRLPNPPDAVVFMAGDGSNDPGEITTLLDPIDRDNAELVIGVRRGKDHTAAGQAGTRVAIGLISAIYRHQFEDLGPFRAIRFPALVALGMADPGEGWNVEMQVKALKLGLHIVEVPVSGWTKPPSNRSPVRKAVQSVGTTGRMLFQIFRHATVR